MPPNLKAAPNASPANTCSVPWIAAKPSAALTAPLNAVAMALPPKVQRSGPRRGTPAWERWLRAGAFVHNFAPWHWFVTLTFKFQDVSWSTARGRLRSWLDALAREAGAHLKVAFTIEGHQSGAPHVHALVSFPEDARRPTTAQGDELWRKFGAARVRVFSGDAGGAWYVAKKEAGSDMTYGCPRDAHRCRRHGGCAFARANKLKA